MQELIENVVTKGCDYNVTSPRPTSTEDCRPPDFSNRKRFLAALRFEHVDRPPVWLMRQAGRCLPEYRALRQRFSFRELISTPSLAAEVTLQPVQRFDFDAAILFSDILVVPEALGQPFEFADSGGVRMLFPVRSNGDVEKLNVGQVPDRLAHVGETIRLIRQGLDGHAALLGFAGSPWTLANFMIEGGSCRNPVQALKLFREDHDLYQELAWKLTRAVIEFLQVQIDAGVDAIQIFDSLGGLLPAEDFAAASGKWIRTIVTALCSQVPVIVFSKGTRDWVTLGNCGADAIGIDHEIELPHAALQLPEKMVLQGNLDPAVLSKGNPEDVRTAALKLLRAMAGRNGYIFNLGHGVPPNARIENLEELARTVQTFSFTNQRQS